MKRNLEDQMADLALWNIHKNWEQKKIKEDLE